jgi:DNA-binding CsgD family transcriptional regulator
VIDALRVAFQAAVQDDRWRDLRDIAQAYVGAAQGFDGAEELRALLALGAAAAIGGEYRESLLVRRRAWEESNQRIYPSVAVEAGLVFAHVQLWCGQIGAAQEVITATNELVDRIGVRGRLLARNQFVAHEAAFHMGDRRTAVEALLRAASTVAAHYAVSAHQMLATWLALLDGPAAASDVLANIEAGRDCATAAGCPRCGLELELWAAKALAWIGRPDDARRTIEAWEAARPDPNPDDGVTRRWVEGLVAAHESSSGPAVEHLSTALAGAERQGRTIEAICMRLDLGRILSEADRAAAAEHFAKARAEAHDAGSVALERLADRRLRDLGVRTWRRGPVARQPAELGGRSTDVALSPRELEVAGLVIEGASNPEIAAQLFLSRKTVERHVSNALAKVGARNRTELARRLEEINPSR